MGLLRVCRETWQPPALQVPVAAAKLCFLAGGWSGYTAPSLCLCPLQDDMGELGLCILEKAYGRFDTGKRGSLDKLQFAQVCHKG